MTKRSIIRAIRGHDTWAIVDWCGLDEDAVHSVGYCADSPEEFFRGDDNAPPEDAQRGEIWEWQGILSTDDSGGDDVGEWVRVGELPPIEEGPQ